MTSAAEDGEEPESETETETEYVSCHICGGAVDVTKSYLARKQEKNEPIVCKQCRDGAVVKK